MAIETPLNKINNRHIGKSLKNAVMKWQTIGILWILLIIILGIVLFNGVSQRVGLLIVVGGASAMSGWVICWLLGWLLNRRPMKKILTLGNSLSEQFNNFSIGLSDLAQGNLTYHHDIDTPSFNIDSSSELENLWRVIEKIYITLIESIKDFNTVTDKPCRRLCYVGSDPFLEGQACGEAMGKFLGGQGDVAILTGSFSAPGLVLRQKGFQSMVHERFPGIRVVEIRESIFDPEIAYHHCHEMIKQFPSLVGLYSTDGTSLPGLVKAVQEAGKTGRIKVVTHDMVNTTMQALIQGVVTATLGQDPIPQGHDPSIILFNHLVSGWEPSKPRMLTQMDLVTIENYQNFWHPEKGLLLGPEIEKRLLTPIQKSAKPIRIAVLDAGEGKSAFWEDHIHQGYLKAKHELSMHNGQIDWITPPSLSAADFGKTIEELVKQGYDAIATPIFDNELVPVINRLSDRGIPVVIFNGEPMGLRGLIKIVKERSSQFLENSNRLMNLSAESGETIEQIAKGSNQMAFSISNGASAVQNISDNIQRISDAMTDVSRGAVLQNKSIGSLSQAADEISRVAQVAESSSKVVAEATNHANEVTNRGATSVRQTLQQMQTINQASLSSARAMEEMRVESLKINDFLSIIEDIAAQTNLLALNAAIEAARAGEHGRGFTVVAEEVRKLSQKSTDAAKEINVIVGSIQKNIDNNSQEMKKLIDKVEEGASLAENSGQSLDQLLTSIASTKQQAETLIQANAAVSQVVGNLENAINQVSLVIEQNISVTEKVNVQTQSTLEAVENVAAVYEENASAAQEISASTEEVSAQAREVGKAAALLAGFADDLLNSTVQFKID